MTTTRELEDITQELKALPEVEEKQRDNILTVRKISSLVDEYLALADKSEHMHMARYLELRTVIFYELGRQLHWKESGKYRELPDEFDKVTDILKHLDEAVADKVTKKCMEWSKFNTTYSLLKKLLDESTDNDPNRNVFIRIENTDDVIHLNGQALLDKFLHADMHDQNGMRTMPGERFFAARYDKRVLDHLEDLQKKSVVGMVQLRSCVVTYKPYWWFGENEEVKPVEVAMKSSHLYDRYMWQEDDGIRTPYAMKAVKVYYDEKYKKDRAELEKQLRGEGETSGEQD